MKKYSKKLLLVNTFGTLGYLFCFLLWGWIGIIYLPMILANEHVEGFLIPMAQEESIATPSSSEMSPFTMLIALTVTIAVMILTVIIILRAPITIAKTGKTVTTRAADSALPLITKSRPVSKIEKRRLTAQLVKLIKLLLVLLPVASVYIGMIVELPLPFDIALFVGSGLAIIALFWFSAQYIASRLFSVDTKQLV